MKTLLIGLLALTSLTLFAQDGCTVNIKVDTSDGGYNSSLLKKKHALKIEKIMKKKGYTVQAKSNGKEDLVLRVSANQHYMCGYSASQASFRENISIDTSYSVSLKVPAGNEVYEKVESFDRLFFALPKTRTRKALMKAIKEIPTCSN